MKMNSLKRLLAVLLIIGLVLPLLPQQIFAAEETVSIGTLAELQKLAQKCSLDSYSKGLKVVLTADIDAKNKEISVPIFYGNFDGQDHTITQLQLDGEESDYGLFCTVGEGAVIQNLHIKGEIAPKGTQSTVGAIAGDNYGTILNCTFEGIVSAETNVGGISGKNEATGVIENCRTSGVVRGTKYIGGVSGYNAGTITRAVNEAAVNTTLNEAEQKAADLDGVENTIYSILKQEAVTDSSVISDIGGIAGYSSGIVQTSENHGKIGYQHVGYNIGGIVGRENGYVAACKNYAEVLGRKDVGGIVGQMTPDITLINKEDGLGDLETEINKLQNMLDQALTHAENTSDEVAEHLDQVSDYAATATDSTHDMMNELENFTNENIAVINDMSLIMEKYLADLAPITEEMSAAAESMDKAMLELKGLVDIDNWDEDELDMFKQFKRELTLSASALNQAYDSLLEAKKALDPDNNITWDTSKLERDIQIWQDDMSALEQSLEQALAEINDNGAVSEATKAQLNENLQEVLESTRTVMEDWAEILADIDFSAWRDSSIDALKNALRCLKNAADYAQSASEHFQKALDYLQAWADLHDKDADKYTIDNIFNNLEKSSKKMNSALNKTKDWINDLAAEDRDDFTVLGDDFSDAGDELNTALRGINNELTAIKEINNDSSLLSEVRALNNQAMNVMNMFFDLLDETQNADYTDIYEDISEQSLKNTTLGKVWSCQNYGTIQADRNVGGIAGAMALDVAYDPEDDRFNGENKLRFTYQSKAIVYECANYGIIQAKKSCAGGVVGRMDIGTVAYSGGYGEVTSENGDYIGAVAGLSLSSISHSYAKCPLSGRKYVGGIVGSGKKITDNLAFVDIREAEQYSGAIAGEITGEYRGNYFVSDALAGVDRVSYQGKAEPLSYEEMCQRKDIPQEFLKLSLNFVAEEEIVKTVEFAYGDSFDEAVYPTVEVQSGSYVRWDRENLQNLHMDTTVNAIYEPYVTTLASEEERNGKPLFLVQGDFCVDDILAITAQTALEETEEWALTIPDDDRESHIVRWLMTDKNENYIVYVDYGDGAEKVKAEKNGSYLCFEMSQSGSVIIQKETQFGHFGRIIIIAAVATGIFFGVKLRKRKK